MKGTNEKKEETVVSGGYFFSGLAVEIERRQEGGRMRRGEGEVRGGG
jgi:hypothetical protein